jgi:hypothetical protein
MTNKNFATSKNSFRKNLQGVNNVFVNNNDTLNVDFIWNGHRFFLAEEHNVTNGGASFSNLKITKYGSNEVVYSDYYHNGKGAWQTCDSAEYAADYNDLTEYILKVFRSFLES